MSHSQPGLFVIMPLRCFFAAETDSVCNSEAEKSIAVLFVCVCVCVCGNGPK